MSQKKESPWRLSLYQWGDEPIPKEYVSYLQSLNALDENRKFTAIGEEMVKLPIEARWARMLVEAKRLGVMTGAIRAVAIMRTGSLIYNGAVNPITQERLTYKDVSLRNCTISDILSEVEFFDDIVNRRYSDLYKAGVYVENLRRVKKEIESLRDMTQKVYGHIDDHFEKEKYSVLMRAIIVGLPDCIYECYTDSKGHIDVGMPNQSVNDFIPLPCRSYIKQLHDDDLIIGIPYTTEKKTKIMTFSTILSKDAAIQLLPDMVTCKYNVSDTVYHKPTDTFLASCSLYIGSVFLKWKRARVCKEDPDWDRVNRMCGWMRSRTVRVGDNSYPLYADSEGCITNCPVVDITNINDVKKSTIDAGMIHGNRIVWRVEINGETLRSDSLDSIRKEIETIERGYNSSTAIGSKFASMGINIKDLPAE